MKVIIPVKKTSTRCENKNFKPFYNNKSLFDIKVEQLINSGIDKKNIVIATDNLELRNDGYSIIDDSAYNHKWNDAIEYWMQQIEDEDVAVTPVTSPMFNGFSDIWKSWDKVSNDGHDSLVVVKRNYHFLMDKNGRPINFGYGPWHTISQSLPEWYTMECSCFVIKTKVARYCHYWIGMNPYLYEDHSTTIDIDTDVEFRFAQKLYAEKQK